METDWITTSMILLDTPSSIEMSLAPNVPSQHRDHAAWFSDRIVRPVLLESTRSIVLELHWSEILKKDSDHFYP